MEKVKRFTLLADYENAKSDLTPHYVCGINSVNDDETDISNWNIKYSCTDGVNNVLCIYAVEPSTIYLSNTNGNNPDCRYTRKITSPTFITMPTNENDAVYLAPG